MIDSIPLPSRDGPFEAPFWAALDEGRIAHQRCTRCERWHFPPRFRCECGGALNYQPVSGRGTLWSFVVVQPPVLPALAAYAPYVSAIVELVEASGLRMAGHVVRQAGDPINTISPDMLTIGMPLQTHVRAIGDGVKWPVWSII